MGRVRPRKPLRGRVRRHRDQHSCGRRVVVGFLSSPNAAIGRRSAQTGQERHACRASSRRMRVLTTSVEPAEAKPGETVTFKVTAKLDPGYHIYKYSKEPGARARSARPSTSSIRRA